eukprot:3152533-Alexandrium_andersonii.AAC.1
MAADFGDRHRMRPPRLDGCCNYPPKVSIRRFVHWAVRCWRESSQDPTQPLDDIGAVGSNMDGQWRSQRNHCSSKLRPSRGARPTRKPE